MTIKVATKKRRTSVGSFGNGWTIFAPAWTATAMQASMLSTRKDASDRGHRCELSPRSGLIWLVARVDVQAEGVPRRIQHDANLVLGLVRVQLGP